MRELLLATSNPGKFKEIMEIFGELPFKVVGLFDLDLSTDGLEESGETYRDNALIKAKFFADQTGMLTMAEDSGLVVDALEGELGVKTRRWGAGENATDQEWLDYFMERMGAEDNRRARFVCSGCLLDPSGAVGPAGSEYYFDGETVGFITEEVLAPILPGLPLSSCFQPEGMEKVYSALTTEEKNLVSHRGKAMKKLQEFLSTKF